MCCVSLSTFYNANITECPTCSCGCRDADKSTKSCIRLVPWYLSPWIAMWFCHTIICYHHTNFKIPIKLKWNLLICHDSQEGNQDIVRCTHHMCPIRVHWHIKNSYTEYWRVKLTVTNYNYQRNYSDWNVLVQHPNFKHLEKTFSFNSTLLPAVGLGGTFINVKTIKMYQFSSSESFS